MNIVVIGCGRLGSELARGLSARGHKISVVDSDHEAFYNLGPEFKGKMVEGHALNRDILVRAGIEEADGLVAVTTSDALNMVLGHLAKSIFKTPHVVVRNYKPEVRQLFDVFNLQAVGSTAWGAQKIEELINYSELETVFSAGNGEVEVYKFVIPGSANGRRLSDLMPARGANIVALTRAGKAQLPAPDCTVNEGDILNISATFEGVEAFRNQLNREV